MSGDRVRPATTPATTCFIALDVAATELYGEGPATVLEGEQAQPPRTSMVTYLRRARRQLSDLLHRGRHEPRTIGRGWRELTEALGDRVQLVGDDFVRHQCRAAQAGDRASGVANADTRQGQPDRHAHRDARRRAHGARRGYAAMSHRSGRPRTRPSPTSPVPTDSDGSDRSLARFGPRREIQPAHSHRGGAGEKARYATRRCCGAEEPRLNFRGVILATLHAGVD